MLNRKIVIITIIFSALIVGLWVSFAFGNTLNPNCPDEIKQAIQNWDNGLDERDANNSSELIVHSSEKSQPRTTNHELRTLFLSSLITLTFNTPVHSQILVSNLMEKLFTVAKHYIKVQSSEFRVQSLVAVFVTIKRYFEKIFLILLGLIFPVVCCFTLTHLLTYSLTHRLYYRFHNLRL